MNRKKNRVNAAAVAGRGSGAAAGVLILPRYMLGDQPSTITPNNRVNVALIGVGFEASSNRVDDEDRLLRRRQEDGSRVPGLPQDAGREGQEIDAVLIATPDHTMP